MLREEGERKLLKPDLNTCLFHSGAWPQVLADKSTLQVIETPCEGSCSTSLGPWTAAL